MAKIPWNKGLTWKEDNRISRPWLGKKLSDSHKESVKKNLNHIAVYITDEDKRLNSILKNISNRCFNKNIPAYKDYGARGITICNEWLGDFQTFKKWALENGYQKELSIDRINNNGNYEPGNCRWATSKEQSLNRRNTIFITYNGVTKPLAVWAEEMEINYFTLIQRYKRYGVSPKLLFDKRRLSNV